MDEAQELAEGIAALATRSGLTVAAAESVSAGKIATALAAAPEASEWFRASVVAYSTAMKQKLLHVAAPKVISAECARQMADGVLLVTDADVAVTVTGVGGPDMEDGEPAGTVIICAGGRDSLETFEHRFDGGPAEVVEQATLQSLRHLRDAMERVGS